MVDNSFIINRVYMRGSLINTSDGFEFTLRNTIENGTLGALKSVSVDGFNFPLEATSVQTNDGTWLATAISYSNIIPIKVGSSITIRIAGKPLSPGQHTISLTVSIVEVGQIQLKISDTI